MRNSRIIVTALFSVVLLSANVACAQQPTKAVDQQRLQALLPQMVKIPAGSFKMGDSGGEGDANELPVHTVNVKPFAMAATEVTFDLYDLFSEATGREKKKDQGWGRGNHPVVNVRWADANDFTVWLSKQTGRSFRLPTEAEWEYAANAGANTIFSWGNSMSREYGNYGPHDCCEKGTGKSGRDQWDYTAPVASFKPNAWGLYDTAGNAWEWVADCLNETYVGAPTDGSAWMTGDCQSGVLRGGSYTHYSRNVRTANRNTHKRDYSADGYSFRIAEDIK
jgi:formylglycine-generating enzyme required for sulfatase activity